MSDRVCRWGILGTAQIARKNWCAIQMAENATLVAVASRDLHRSMDFIGRCQAEIPFTNEPLPLGSYHSLLERDDVDAVYIPLPTGVRQEWILQAAARGKHVLCEKPCAIGLRELDEMLAACRTHHVQFMDAVMFMHSSRLETLRNIIDDPRNLGRLKRIQSHFSFLADEPFHRGNIRVDGQLEPLGCLGDLGWYTIRFTLWVLNWALPRHVRARTLSQTDPPPTDMPVPTELSAELVFDDGVSAGFYCGFETANQQTATVSGSHGYVHLDDFVLPFHGRQSSFEIDQSEFVVKNCQFEMRRKQQAFSIAESSNNAATAQETTMFRNFSNLVLSDQIDESWFSIARKTQTVIDACMQSASTGGQLIEVAPS